jgi:hypothetical protein
MTSIEMKTLSKPSEEQKNIDELGKRVDEINTMLANGQQAYEFMQKQTSKVQGDKNKESHKEDLQNMKKRIDELEKMKRRLKLYIYRFEKEIAKKKKGGRRTRKKRGKRTRRRKSKRKKRRTRRAGTLKQSKEPGKRGLTNREIELRSKRRKDKIEKVSENIRKKLFNDRFSNLSISRDRSPSPPGFDKFVKDYITPPSTPPSGGKKTRKKRRRKRRR